MKPQELGAVRQVGYVVDDLDAAIRHWTTALGVGPFFAIDDQPIRAFEHRGRPSAPRLSVALSYSGPVQIELIQPRDDAPSMWREFLDSGGQGVHHVAFWSSRYDDDLAGLRDAGWEVVQHGRSGSGGPDERFCYLQAAGAGAVVELSESGGPKARIYDLVARAAGDWDGSNPVRSLDPAALAAVA
jgi:hypothetical protein